MDRLSWYQPAESMEEILCQAGHVGIFDGDLKQSTFEQGTASLTLQRIIWADATDPDCRLILHHSLVERIERHHRSMFGRGGKIIVTLKPVGAHHIQGPVASSGFNSLRFVFRSGGEEDFYKRYTDALSRQMWKRTSSSSSSAGSRSSHAQSTTVVAAAATTLTTPSQRSLTLSVSEKRLTEQNNKIHETISQAFEDMTSLMEKTRDMVSLSKAIADRLKDDTESTDEATNRFREQLQRLGVVDPLAAPPSDELIDEVCDELQKLLAIPVGFRPLFRNFQQNDGVITLAEAFCQINRNREKTLISPEDLMNVCTQIDQMDLPIGLCVFDDGVIGVQLKVEDKQVAETTECVSRWGALDSQRLSNELGISVDNALERLLAAESQERLCRDNVGENILFYPNHFGRRHSDAPFP